LLLDLARELDGRLGVRRVLHQHVGEGEVVLGGKRLRRADRQSNGRGRSRLDDELFHANRFSLETSQCYRARIIALALLSDGKVPIYRSVTSILGIRENHGELEPCLASAQIVR